MAPVPLSSPQQVGIPLLGRAQPKDAPRVICSKVPLGGANVVVALKPQQASVPSVFRPQEVEAATATSAKSAPGGVDCPEELEPQHCTSPLVRTPHAWFGVVSS